MRDAFEDVVTCKGKWPRAADRGPDGTYLLAQTATAWETWKDAWKASRDALQSNGPTAWCQPASDATENNVDAVITASEKARLGWLAESYRVPLFAIPKRDGNTPTNTNGDTP